MGVQFRVVLVLVIFLRSRSGRESQVRDERSRGLGFGAREIVGRLAAAVIRADRDRGAGSLLVVVVEEEGRGVGELMAFKAEAMAADGTGRALLAVRGFVMRDFGTGREPLVFGSLVAGSLLVDDVVAVDGCGRPEVEDVFDDGPETILDNFEADEGLEIWCGVGDFLGARRFFRAGCGTAFTASSLETAVPVGAVDVVAGAAMAVAAVVLLAIVAVILVVVVVDIVSGVILIFCSCFLRKLSK